MQLISNILSKIPKPFLVVLIVGGIVPLCVVDYFLEPRISLLVFYLFPVFLGAWFGGRKTGIAISLISAIGWIASDIISAVEFSHPVIPYWNLSVTFGVFLIVSLTVSKLRDALRRANELARSDPLTGTANRRAFFELAGTELYRMGRYKRSFTLAYMDLDDFKRVNDRLGHEAGDELLKNITAAIEANIRSSDILARLGGDEFAILLPETNEDQAKAVIQKLDVSLQAEIKRGAWEISYSIGVVTFLRPPPSVDEMLKKADHMMYSAKKNGKNGVRYLVWKESATVR